MYVCMHAYMRTWEYVCTNQFTHKRIICASTDTYESAVLKESRSVSAAVVARDPIKTVARDPCCRIC